MVYDIRKNNNPIDVIQFADDGFIHICDDLIFTSSNAESYEEYENIRGVTYDEIEIYYKAMKKAKGIIDENRKHK